jgi:hypothetical protein
MTSIERTRAIWREITALARPDWFWSSEFLLRDFRACRGDPRFPQLVAMQRAEAKVIASYATKLRLTPRSTGSCSSVAG